MKLFGRRASIVVGSTEILSDGLRFAFEVKSSLKPAPNQCTIQIWNLGEARRATLEGFSDIPCIVKAGYQDAQSVLFFGRLREATTTREGADLITTIGAGDGEAEIKRARVNASFAAGTPPATVLSDVARALGVLPGNLAQAIPKIRASLGSAAAFSVGTVVSGRAPAEMTRICEALGLEWSVQSGQLQILPRGEALAGAAILLSPQTGLIGAPAINGKGVLTATMLLARDVTPGRLLVLDSERIKGQFRIEEVSTVGDTKAEDWTHEITALRY